MTTTPTTEAELVDRITDELAQWPIGSGYYQTAVSTDEAREMAAAILTELRPHLRTQNTTQTH